MKEIKNENKSSKINFNESIYQLNTKDNFNNDLPKEEEPKQTEENIYKENLMFDFKEITICRLYYHITGKCELCLMILAIIFTIGAGCGHAIKASLLGDVLNVLQQLGTSWISYLDDELYKETMDAVEPEINKTIRKFLIYGSILFVLNFLSFFFWFYVGLRQMHNLKISYFSLFLKQEQGWFDENNAYEFSTKVQAQLDAINSGLGDNPRNIIFFIINAIAGYYIGFKNSWKITLILTACSLPFIIIGHILNRYGLEYEKINALRVQEKTGGIAEEILYNIKTITSFANFDYEIKRYEDAFKSPGGPKKIITMAMVFGLVLFGINFGISIGSIYVRKLIENKTVTAGKVTKVFLALYGAFMSLFWLFPSLILLRGSCISSSDYFNLYERIPKIYVSEKNLKPDRETIQGNIEFKNIKFYYPSDKNQKLILNGINFLVPSGKKVALVGESGCGKSTTMSLIERLYEPTEGEILLDGINIKEYNLEYLRDLIGFVKQDHFLFNKSIKHNIIFGREETLRQNGNLDDILEKVCNDALIKDFIEKKIDKYEYNVGVKGNKLLSSHKQRVSIARAILGQPKIIILDEATSFLDSDLEQQILQTIDEINKNNITILIIGNNLNILKKVDIIYTLKEGRIIEYGNHEELMAKNGYYAGLVKSGFKDDISEGDINEEEIINDRGKMTQKYTNFMSQTMKYQFGDGDEDEKTIKFQPCKLFELISDKKFDLILGIIGALIYGAGFSSSNFIFGKLKTSLTINSADTMKKQVLKWAWILIVLALFWVLFYYIQDLKFGGLGSTVVLKTRKSIFQKYLELHMGFFDFELNNPSNLLSKLSNDTSTLRFYFTSVFSSIFIISGLMIFALIIGFYYSWRLTLILLCFFPLRVLFIFLSGKFKYEGQRKYKENRIQAGSYFSECVTNTNTIYSFNFQQGAIDIYKSILETEINEYIKDCIFLSLFNALIDFLPYVANSVAYKSGMHFIRHRTITFEKLIHVKTTCMAYIDGIYYRIRGFWEYSRVKIAFKSIYKILNTPSEINAFEYANLEKIKVNNLKGKIEFKNVTFSYPTKPNQKILRNISFVIPPTKWVAFVGNSESGKSTIVQLINRFYDVYKGEILIDDINIKDYNLYELRKKVGYMSQDTVLFKRNIYENILYGNLNASKEDVINAANKALIHKLLQEKIDIDKHNSTSEGEKQRISLARIFLKNPDILLLDSMTSSVDSNNEKEIYKSVTQLHKGRTSIIITHRLSNIVDCDIIFYMEKGSLVEQGTHKELLELKGKYYNFYKSSGK